MKSDQTDRTYRLSVLGACSMIVAAPIAGLFQGWVGALAWTFGGLLAAVVRGGTIRLRLTGESAQIAKFGRWRVVPWSSVTAVRRSSWFGSGVILDTDEGPVRTMAPTSWWGGPATPEQVAEIERWWRRNVELSSLGGA